MSPHEQPDDLGRLLNDAVSDIEPRSGIQAIRSRTSAKESVMTTTRNWIFGAFGAAVATAAVITGVVLAGNNNPSADDDNTAPGNSTSPSTDVTDLPTDEPTDPVTGDREAAVPIYYVGETPQGPRLYREFQEMEVCPNPGCLFSASAEQAVLGMPLDPDYRNPWPGGPTGVSATYNGDFITVDIETDDAQALHDGPAGITPDQADIAIQSLIYSAQAGLGQGRPAVQLLINGSHTDQVLGQPASEPIANGPVLATLAHVNITTPEQGEIVSGDTLEVTGVANSNEANVLVKLQRYEGTDIVDQQPFTADGWMGNKLFPFSGTLDISGASPGTYILSASTDDPSGGEEGFGPHTDSKIITIE